MGFNITGKIYVPADDLVRFLLKYCPGTDGEISFGPMRLEYGELSVEFAAGTECSPEDWAEPPHWIARPLGDHDIPGSMAGIPRTPITPPAVPGVVEISADDEPELPVPKRGSDPFGRLR